MIAVMDSDRLRDVVRELSSRPGHEKVRALVYALMVDGLGADSKDVTFEQPVPEVRGRLDALLGRTVFEFKRDLRRERSDAEEELTRYLSDRERSTGQKYVGIATDGVTFAPYHLTNGRLSPLSAYTVRRDAPRDLLAWLDTAVSIDDALLPEPATVERELGKASLAYDLACESLVQAWSELGADPEAKLKRELWAQLLERVYGAPVDTDELFIQHTYLTIVAKAMATQVLGAEFTDADSLLSGSAFVDAGIYGAVESDFFDWVLLHDGGVDIVERLWHQVRRFRLVDVRHDVLKVLYESLIDPEQRKDLGEYLHTRLAC
jgi:hypothetical protein